MRKLPLSLSLWIITYLLTIRPIYALTFSVTRPTQTVDPDQTGIGKMVTFIINALIVIGIIASLAFLLYGGIKWITSGGDKGAVEQARNHVIAAIIGLVIILLAFVILKVVFELLGISVDLFNFSIPSLAGNA